MTQIGRSRPEGFIRGPASNRANHRAGRALSSVHPAPRLSLRSGGRAAVPARPPGRPHAARRRSPGAVYVMAALVAVSAIIGVRALLHRGSTPAGAVAPQGASAPPAATAIPTFTVDQPYVDGYQAQLGRYVGTLPGKYGVAAVDLTTGKTLGLAQNDVFRAASVNKLELIVALYRRAEANRIDLDAKTTIGADEIQNYGTGTIQLGGSGQSFSYRDLAALMIKESDNTAAYVLGQRLGLDSVQRELESWGLTQTSMADNQTTASDVALLLSRFVRGELTSSASTAEILGLMEHTAWTDRLQSGVPTGVTVAHKIGTDVGVYNDAAVFLNGPHPYVVVVLTSGTDEPGAVAGMTGISRLLYAFESGLPAVTTRTIGR